MSVTVNLVVIRSDDLDRSRHFYEALGIQFSTERHGNGPEHLAAELGGVVFEIYPRGKGPATRGLLLGFRVASVAAGLAATGNLGAVVATLPKYGPWGLRAAVIDPDGHRVELTQADER